jgi:hypothetical protein
LGDRSITGGKKPLSTNINKHKFPLPPKTGKKKKWGTCPFRCSPSLVKKMSWDKSTGYRITQLLLCGRVS